MAPVLLPKRLPPGSTAEAISAESFNRLIDAIEQTNRRLDLLEQRDLNGPFRGRVEAVDPGPSFATIGTGEAIASECSYTIRVLSRPELAPLVGLQPELGRTVAADSVLIAPAAVGQPCTVWRVPNGDGTYAWVLALQEPDTFADDCQEGGA